MEYDHYIKVELCNDSLKNQQLYNFKLFTYTIARLRVALKHPVDGIDKTEKSVKNR